MKKYNKHYLKKNPSDGKVIIQGGKKVDGKIIGGEPVLGEIAKRDCPLEDWHIKALNRSWKKTGIYYAEVEKETLEKTDSRLELELEAEDLGISFRSNIGDEKLQEKINEAKAKN